MTSEYSEISDCDSFAENPLVDDIVRDIDVVFASVDARYSVHAYDLGQGVVWIEHRPGKIRRFMVYELWHDLLPCESLAAVVAVMSRYEGDDDGCI